MKIKALFIFILSLSTLVAATPMSKDRADQLIGWYFSKYFPKEGCGAAMPPLLKGDYWESTVALGYSGTPSGMIRVNRLTGKVSYLGPLHFRPDISSESLENWAASRMRKGPKR